MATQSSIEPTKPSSGLSRFMPILAWLPSYDKAWLVADVLAGLTLWGLVVPEGMAYAGIAELPPHAGLYTLVASLLVYALFGSSRHLSVGATSATAALIASTVIAVGITTEDMPAYQATTAALVLIIGFIFLGAYLAKLGWVTQFLSKPVMDGFVLGLAIFVAVGQLSKLFGVEKGHGNVFQKFFAVIRQLPEANWVTFAIGASALLLLFVLPRVNKKIPAGLIVLFGSIALSMALNLNGNYGVEVAGALPQGLPSISLPSVPWQTLAAMILPAVGIFLVAYSEALGVAREFGEKHRYEIDPDQELNAHAFTNLASGLLGGMIAAGGMSGSAVKEGAGARTQISNLIAWGATIVTLLFLTPLFKSLPEAVLAALIIHAVWHVITSRKLQKILQVSRTEFWLAALTLAGVLFIDVFEGMIIGVVASMALVIYQSSRPHMSSLGRVPGTSGAYSDINRHSENITVPGVLILRLDAPMYYANALTVRDQIKVMIDQTRPTPRAILLDSAGQDSLDITSAEVLKGLVRELRGKGIDVYVAEVHATVREASVREGLLELISEDHIFPTVDAAVRALEKPDLPG